MAKHKRERERRVNLPKTATEPAMVRGLVVAVLALLGGIGVTWAADVDKKTIGLIASVITALIPLAQALWTRYAVTPNAVVALRVSLETGHVVPGPAASIIPEQPATLEETA